jgi:hypothetical protein
MQRRVAPTDGPERRLRRHSAEIPPAARRRPRWPQKEADRKRDLLRLWLAAPDFDDGDGQLRRGIAVR